MTLTRIFLVLLLVSLSLSVTSHSHADEAEYRQIRAGMKKLAPLIGEWNSTWRFYRKDGVEQLTGPSSIPAVPTSGIQKLNFNYSVFFQ